VAAASPVRYRRVEAVLVYGLSAFLRLLPLGAVRALGAALGRLAYAVDGFHRRLALENVALALPSKTPRTNVARYRSPGVRALWQRAVRADQNRDAQR
jgi:lauroyl/myristoyl acyltransferase